MQCYCCVRHYFDMPAKRPNQTNICLVCVDTIIAHKSILCLARILTINDEMNKSIMQYKNSVEPSLNTLISAVNETDNRSNIANSNGIDLS
jgi:hypothetical protein